MAESNLFDAHCHVASTRFIPRSFGDGVLANVSAMRESLGLDVNTNALREAYLATLQDHDCDELVRQMDRAGVGRTVLLVPDFTFCLRDCEYTIAEMFALHAAIRARHPGRFEVVGGVDPRWGKDGIDLFEHSVGNLGFSGLKLYPPCGYAPNDRSLFPYYEICSRSRLPVVVHMGPTSSVLGFSTARPEYVDEVARLFPKVPFILAHGATAHASDCIAMCLYRPNVFLDVSGFQSLAGHDPDYDELRRVLQYGIPHKILYGTDWPVFRLEGDPVDHAASFLAVAEEAVGRKQLAMILRENAERLWGRGTNGAQQESAPPRDGSQ